MNMTCKSGLQALTSKKHSTRKVMFEALRNQGVAEPMIALLLDLYSRQLGCVSDSAEFAISRGVRQGELNHFECHPRIRLPALEDSSQS